MTKTCQARFEIAHSHAQYGSKSNPDKKYNTYIFRPEGNFCNCFPFLTGRKKLVKNGASDAEVRNFACSHIRDLIAVTCDWVQNGEDSVDLRGKCPKCSGPIVDVDGLLAPDTDATIADLRALFDELRATDPRPTIVDDKAPVPTAAPAPAKSNDKVEGLLALLANQKRK